MNDRIKILRTEILKMTMEEFAKRIGLTRSSISLIESGTRSVTNRNVWAICSEFHVREEWLRYGTGEPLISDTNVEIESLVTKYGLSELDKIILSKWVGLTAAQRRVLDDFLISVMQEYQIPEEGETEPESKGFENMTPEEIADQVRQQREAEKKDEAG